MTRWQIVSIVVFSVACICVDALLNDQRMATWHPSPHSSTPDQDVLEHFYGASR